MAAPKRNYELKQITIIHLISLYPAQQFKNCWARNNFFYSFCRSISRPFDSDARWKWGRNHSPSPPPQLRPWILWNPMVHHTLHKSYPGSVSKSTTSRPPPPYEICFNIVLPPTPRSLVWLLSFIYSVQNCVYISDFTRPHFISAHCTPTYFTVKVLYTGCSTRLPPPLPPAQTFLNVISQSHNNTGRPAALATNFCTMAPHIFNIISCFFRCVKKCISGYTNRAESTQ
jgi:hypothetical protein